MSRGMGGAILLLVLVGSSARAQGFGYGTGYGSTPAGDYLRGVGIAAAGMGSYNEATARADRTEAETFMMLNEYMWNVVKNENRENAEHRRERLERNAEAKRKLDERIHDHPEELDVMTGDALNAKLNDLLAPSVSDSASRYARVPLGAEVIRRIPFKLDEKGARFSMIRLSLKGPKKWPIALQDDRFAPYRKAYQRAVDDALELAIDGKMTIEAIKALEKAVDDLEAKLKRTPEMLDRRNQRLYHEAKEQVDRLREAVQIFKTTKIQRVLAEIDGYAGTTVDDLRLFMRRHGLRFGAAESPEERSLFPQLYTALVEQTRKATGVE